MVKADETNEGKEPTTIPERWSLPRIDERQDPVIW